MKHKLLTLVLLCYGVSFLQETTLAFSNVGIVAFPKSHGSQQISKPNKQLLELEACGCLTFNIKLNNQCQSLLTPSLVTNGICNTGTVRVMDSNVSNGGVIDCAGVWTYGLFDDLNNLVCWGKVTAEDKTAPNFTTDYLTTPLLCSDINTVLNNSKTIGNVGTVVSPGFLANSDDIKNLGQVVFSDNCASCGCTITRKWSDKVIYYGCDSLHSTRFPNLFATILRTWSGTDCFGNTSVTVQEINFIRPSLSDFNFLDDAETDFSNGDLYDAITIYNSCKPDESLIKTNDYTPYLTNYFGNRVFLDKQECNFSIGTIVDERFPICEGRGIKIYRKIPIFDWCTGTIADTLRVLIKIGDFEPPQLSLPAKLPIILSTGPMECSASLLTTQKGLEKALGISISDNCHLARVGTRLKSRGKLVYGIWVNEINWFEVDYPVYNGLITKLPVGQHRLIISAYDGCYNEMIDSVDFFVVDRTAPVMKCNDKLTVTLSNAYGYASGYARVNANEIDEHSTDNCQLDWLRLRRNVPAICAQSFIANGYDTNGNGKLDTLDGFDNNGNGKLEPELLETFRTKGRKLMTPIRSFAEFFCCDESEKVTIELWGKDNEYLIKGMAANSSPEGNYNVLSGGNLNYCWQNISIISMPFCQAPADMIMNCADSLLLDIENPKSAAAIFGDILITDGNECNTYDTTYTLLQNLSCGAGSIQRTWTLKKTNSKGEVISSTCQQNIKIRAVHRYEIAFPADVYATCGNMDSLDGVYTNSNNCDILAVTFSDKRYNSSDTECYKIFRTYTVINWCEYAEWSKTACKINESMDYAIIVPRGYDEFGNSTGGAVEVVDEFIGETILLGQDGIEEIYLNDDEVHPEDFIYNNPKKPRCFIVDDYGNREEFPRYAWMYTQIIKVFDDVKPEIIVPEPSVFCAGTTEGCKADVTINFKASDNCTDQIELATQLIYVAINQSTDSKSGLLPSDFDKNWTGSRVPETKDSFTVSIKNIPIGIHDLIISVRDECGNLSIPTRIPFEIKDCKAPTPICINGLATELMPDGKGGTATTVWAKDFIASPVYDCNGQGPHSKDGLKLITKYSINRLGQPKDINATSLTVTCEEGGRQVLVEIHAWDEKGNDDFCVTYLAVQDNGKVCPNENNELGEISGEIQTEGNLKIPGTTIELSAKSTKNISTASNGKYVFTGLEKGYDYTVTPSLDANPLNGVSTFDLVLMQKHILGIQPLDSPYKMIAADINNSKSITTLDLILLRKLILNLDTKFTANTSWRFVDAAYRFPNPSNPWSEAFPEISSINNLSGKANADFVAVKIGDVNGNASPTSAAAAQPRKAGKLELSTEEQRIEGGQQYQVDIRAKDLKTIEGYQFTLELDKNKVDLVDIDYGVAKAENFGIFQREGILTTSWNRKSGAENDEAILFTLHLQGKGAAKLSEALTISSRYTANEAYQEGGDYLSVAMSYTKPVVISDRPELLQNKPNPFGEQTQIDFYLPQATEGRLTIRDAKGSILYRSKADYNQGWNQVTIKQGDLKAAGVLYYTLETADFIATKKMVILN